jgi:hypothetical protein
VAVMGKLYARQAWQALGQVMASPQLLPTTEVQSAVLRSMFCAPADGMARPLGSPMLPGAHSPPGHTSHPGILSVPSPQPSPPTSPTARHTLRSSAGGDADPSALSDAGDATPSGAASPRSAAAAAPRSHHGGGASGISSSWQSHVKVGDRIYLGTRTRLKGLIRYVGPVHWDQEDWVGIELDSPQGTCNGTIQGVAYFAAPDKFGVFVAVRSMMPQAVPGSARGSPRLLVPTPGAHPKDK